MPVNDCSPDGTGYERERLFFERNNCFAVVERDGWVGAKKKEERNEDGEGLEERRSLCLCVL